MLTCPENLNISNEKRFHFKKTFLESEKSKTWKIYHVTHTHKMMQNVLLRVQWPVPFIYDDMRLSWFPFQKEMHHLMKYTPKMFLILKCNSRSSFLHFFLAALGIRMSHYWKQTMSFMDACTTLPLAWGHPPNFLKKVSQILPLPTEKLRLKSAKYLIHLGYICSFSKKESQMFPSEGFSILSLHEMMTVKKWD